MKKFIASVLAAASVLSVSATAFAASDTKSVTKTGDVEYDVAVTAPKIVLDLVMPAKMSAALNPFGAEIKLSADEAVTDVLKTGIASVAYEIQNKTVDYGVYIDASAITTVETADKTKWKVTTTAPVDGTKGAQLTFTGADTIANFATKTATTSSAAATSATAMGSLVLNSEAVADKDAGTVAGQVKQSKLFYIPAGTADAPKSIYVGFVGALSKSTSTATVEWTEDDAINVNLVLKVSAGPKTFA